MTMPYTSTYVDPATLRTALYERISQDPNLGTESEGDGVARQHEDGVTHIQRRGWKHTHTFADNNISATDLKKERPGFKRLLVLIRAGKLDVVVAWSFDRLVRSRREGVELIEAMIEAKILLSIVRGFDIDMSTPMGQFVADLMLMLARMEMATKSDRLKRANQQRLARGEYIGTRAPFGYSTGLKRVVPAEAALVREAYAHILAGGTLLGLMKKWSDRQESAGRLPLTRAGLRKLLLSPANAGILTFEKREVGRGAWEPIVDEATFRAVQAILKGNAHRKSKERPARKYLLSGIARCGVCAASGQNRKVVGNHPVYRCETGHLTRTSASVDAMAIEAVKDRLAQPDIAHLLTPKAERPDAERLQRRRDELQGIRRNILTLVRMGRYNAEEADEELEPIDTELAEVQATLTGEPAAPDITPLVQAVEDAGDDPERRYLAAHEAWHSLDNDLDRQRAVIKALLDIRLDKGRRGRVFDSTSVAITYID